jgi:hypothetical protein
MSNEKLDSMMRKINALLNRADHPNTPPEEADSARSMAERLMNKYRIEEEDLIKSGALNDEVSTPGHKIIIVCPADSPYYNTYYTVLHWVGKHCGIRVHHQWGADPESGAYSLLGVLVGYEADIRYAETLFNNARMIFADRMEPKPKPDLSDMDNVYRMRSAGMERIKIAKIMGYGDTNSATAKVTNLYKKACKARGEDPTLTGRGTSVTAYKEAYMTSFTNTLYNNLLNARNAAAQGGGGALVLHDRKERVDEAFYQMYPGLRPSNTPATTKGKVSRRSGWTAADERRWRRQQSAAGQAGSNAGKRAANEVNVQGHKAPGRIEG